MHLSKLDDLEPFTTLDGSTIREIAGPASSDSAPARNQSPRRGHGSRRAATTIAHYHRRHRGALLLHRRPRAADASATSVRDVTAGDCVRDPARPSEHELVNTGDEPLVLLCCCAPAYSHEDTVLMDDRAPGG